MQAETERKCIKVHNVHVNNVISLLMGKSHEKKINYKSMHEKAFEGWNET